MRKLLNVCIKEPVQPTICIYPSKNFYGANASEKPEEDELDFFVPDYIVFTAFEDGLVVAAGIETEVMSDFGYNVFDDLDSVLRHKVYLNAVKAFVGTRLKNGEADTEKEAKAQILEELHESGIEVDEEAKNYLDWYETYD